MPSRNPPFEQEPTVTARANHADAEEREWRMYLDSEDEDAGRTGRTRNRRKE
jgi:hypothetical protein